MQIQPIKMNFLEPKKQMGFLAMIFLALTVLTHSASGQIPVSDIDLIADTYKGKKLSGFDFHFLGTSFHQCKQSKRSEFIYRGVEFGLLPDAFYRVILAGKYFTEKNTLFSFNRSQSDQNKLFQLLWMHYFIRWKTPNDLTETDVGLRWALFRNKIAYHDSFGSPMFLGIYIKPSFGYKKLKIGVRFDWGIMLQNNDEFVKELVCIASLLLRYNFK